jgi:hypothetical protein
LIDRRIVSSDFARIQTSQATDLLSDAQQLQELLHREFATTVPSNALIRQRSVVYQRASRLMVAEEANSRRECLQAKHTTAENAVFGSLVGSSRIANGVTGMVAAWKYPDQRWLASRMTAAGATAYGAGAAFNIIETARVRITDELQTRSLRQQHQLSSQILLDRLNTLDELERSFGTVSAAVHTVNSLACARAAIQP